MASNQQRLLKILSQEIGLAPADIKMSDDLRTNLNCDSLELVELLLGLEEEFEVAIPDEVADAWQTVQDIANYIGTIPEGA